MTAKVTEKIFDCVKLMCENGATIEECCKHMNISHATVSRIRKSETYEEYKQEVIMSAMTRKQKQKKEEEPKPVVHTVQVQATHYMMEELKQMNESLRLISNKLAFIVDELTGGKAE